MVLSGVAYLWLLVFVFLVQPPPAPEHDEGLGAHVFWLLMGAQLPVIGYFLLVRMPRNPARGLVIVAIQMTLWCLAWVPVYLLEHQG